MIKIIEYLFFRWKKEILREGKEKRVEYIRDVLGDIRPEGNIHYTVDYVDYKYTNKFDGSVKIKRKYLK